MDRENKKEAILVKMKTDKTNRLLPAFEISHKN